MSLTYDYIIAGGGLTGCVVASRLAEAFPNLSIALIEAGRDVRNDINVSSPAQAWLLGDDYKTTFISTPQSQLNGRSIPLQTGHVLGGGSAVNYGGWTRGDRSGYDEWAELVGDDRWRYDGLLPYWKRAETYPLPGLEEQHGYEGPIEPSAGERGYLLKEPMKNALLEAGVRFNEDQSGGDSRGFGKLIESWSPAGKRSYSAREYNLEGVDLIVNASVAKIMVEDGCATGVQLRDGRELRARNEVVLSAGALITPQLLMLSGIGPKNELEQFGIQSLVDLPEVGKNFWDHASYQMYFKLRNPEEGLAVGSEKFDSNPEYSLGNQMDWITFTNAAEVNDSRRDSLELTINYIAIPLGGSYAPPIDGTHITIVVAVVNPKSRGEVSLRSTEQADLPIMDPKWLSTEHDMAVLRSGARLALDIMETEAAREYMVGETPPPGESPLSRDTSDAELNERIRAASGSFNHAAGTASMGKVVDAECRVYGVRNLRVVDASILPVPIGAHLQASLYGVAERAVEMIIKDCKN